MNAEKAMNDKLWEYNNPDENPNPYNPAYDGECAMDDVITMWMMNDDWYLMIKWDESKAFAPFATVEWFIEDAYNTIEEPYFPGKETLIFCNEEVV
jgi:hypothetical protein